MNIQISIASKLRMAGILTIAALIGVLTAGRLEKLSDDAYLKDQRLATTLQLGELREHIRTEVIDRILKLSELGTIISLNPTINDDRLELAAAALIAATPDLISVGVAPDLIVTQVFPAEGNERALGLDYRSNTQQFPKVKEAMDSGRGLVTGPVNLVQGGQGLILRQPVYVDQRGERAPWGILSLVMDYQKFLASLGVPEFVKDYDILLQDIGEGPTTEHTLFGDPAILNQDPVLLNFEFPYGVWRLAAVKKGGWKAGAPNHMADRFWAVIVIGLGLMLLWGVMRLAETRHLAELRLSNAIEALDHGFVMFGPDDRLVLSNSKYDDMYKRNKAAIYPGNTYESLVRSGLTRGVFPSAKGREEEWMADWLSQRGGHFDREHFLDDGRVIKASDRTMPDGSTVGLRIDVSELKDAQLGAEAANKAKSDFMAVLSHELRTPLTVILGTARLSKQVDRLPKAKELTAKIEGLPDAQAKSIQPQVAAVYEMISGMMEKLERSGEHLLFLVNEILDFAKIEASGLTLDVQPHDIGDIMTTAAGQMTPMIEQKNLGFKLETVSCSFDMDAKRVQQVLMNLLGNAAKFTETGTLSLTAEISGDLVQIRVQDTGMGIPQDQVEKVFEPFHQVDASNKRGIGGTGLGLAISREIIEAHGGSLTASSVEGEGSVFLLTLPIKNSGPGAKAG
jgi:signal transduction histidine kinase